MNNKIDWIENLKGFAIIAVVLGHIGSPITQSIFSWHIPLFFFLSGYFIQPKNILESLKKDFIRLMIPYFIFGSFAILAEWVKRILLPGFNFLHIGFSFLDEIQSLFFWMDAGKIHTYGFVLWFLPALFISKNLILMIKVKIKNTYIIVGLGLILWFVLVNQKFILPLGIDKTLISIIWVSLGLLFKESIEPLLKKHFIVMIIFAASIAFLPIPVLNMAGKEASLPWYNLLYALFIILFLISLFKQFSFLKIFKIWGENSFFVFAIHPYINNIAFFLCVSLLNLGWLAECFVALIILLVLIRIIQYVKNTKYSYFINWF